MLSKVFVVEIFVFARPYIDRIPTHTEQQIAVHSHSGQSTKYYLKRRKNLKPKIIENA
jgi:hypothetical protein